MAAVGDLGGPWEFTDPRRNGAMIPYTDENGPDAGLAERKDHVSASLQNFLKSAGLTTKRAATSVSGNFITLRCAV